MKVTNVVIKEILMLRIPIFIPLLVAAVSCAIFSASSVALEPEEAKELVREAIQVAKDLRESESYYDQYAGAGILVDIGDKDSLQFLVDGLGDNDWVLMRSAIDTLLTVRHPYGLDVLYRYAEQTTDAIFMKFLSESLASRPRDDLSEFLVRLIESDDEWVKKHAMQSLASSEYPGKEQLMTELGNDQNQDPLTRAYGYYGLIGTESEADAVSGLLSITDNWGADALEVLAVALGQHNSDGTRSRLRELRAANTYKVQIAAMASQAGFGNEEATEALISIIAKGKGLDPSVAAASLRRMDAATVTTITAELLECCELNSDTGTRLLESWEYIDADPTALYEWGFTHKNPDIKMQTVWLAGARGDVEYASSIGSLLNDKDSGIRAMASWAIVRLYGEKYAPSLSI
jgi:HEAT repeat protein